MLEQFWARALLILTSDALWAAVIAAVIALTGVALTNHHNRKLQRAALEHERMQKALDRAMSLRRDVYLPAVQGIHRMLLLLVKSIDMRANDDELAEQFAAAAAPVSGMYVVGSNSTVRALHELLSECSAAYIEIARKRLRLRQAMQPDPAAALELVKLGLGRFRDLLELLPAAIFAVREEMEFPVDQDAFRADFLRQLEKLETMLSTMVADAQLSIEGAGADSPGGQA
jgi:hypothetical protein